MPVFTKVVLFTDIDGFARWRCDTLALDQGRPDLALSALLPACGLQLRRSPVGFASGFHCTSEPQWVFILQGQMQIQLQDASVRNFRAGEHFYAADVLPPGQSFNARVHGHSSCQLGAEELITLFVRT